MSKIDIDWSQAPDGATHYSPETCDWLPCWVKQEGTAWFVRPANRTVDPWIEDSAFTESVEFLAPRPKPTPVWNGEGLPPVGTVCEFAASTQHQKAGYPEGTKVKVYANFTDDRGVALAAFVDETGKVGGTATSKFFRPIRTPEQIAAEEREREDIRSLASAIHKHAVYCRLSMSDFGAESLAMHLYADGCRVAE